MSLFTLVSCQFLVNFSPDWKCIALSRENESERTSLREQHLTFSSPLRIGVLQKSTSDERCACLKRSLSPQKVRQCELAEWFSVKKKVTLAWMFEKCNQRWLNTNWQTERNNTAQVSAESYDFTLLPCLTFVTEYRPQSWHQGHHQGLCCVMHCDERCSQRSLWGSRWFAVTVGDVQAWFRTSESHISHRLSRD